MAGPDYKINSWAMREQQLEMAADGSGSAQVGTINGPSVSIFTWRGDAECAAFTTMECTYCGRVYHVRLPRAYHPRWWRRLCESFAHDLWLEHR